MKIKYKTHFCAAHKLDGYEGDCANLHGHTWEVIFSFDVKKLDAIGISIDFRILKQEIKKIIPDHCYLNDVYPVNPTAENIAMLLYQEIQKIFPSIHSVEVFESKDASVIAEIGDADLLL